jgi:SAM-dependent methyltransferase
VSDRYGGEYDSVVRWDKRLAREAPFFKDLFEERDVTSLADVGCGTGKHAILFSTWGIEVWGLDPNEEMLEGARENAHEAGANVHLALAGFGEVHKTVGEVDAAVSLGNALPHVGDIGTLRVALADLAEAIRPGGPLVIHMLNHDRIDSQGLRLLPSVMRSCEMGDTVTIKAIDHAEDHFMFEFVRVQRTHRPDGAADDEPSVWTAEAHRSRHAKILGATLREELEAAGFRDIEVFGDHSGNALDVTSDESGIWVATRS